MTASPDPSAVLASLHADLMARWPETRMEPSLTRISRLMELLGDPQRSTPAIHLTGTNGKTSTARMVESLLRSFGLSTGLYTSPHLASVTERIMLNGEPVSDERFVETYYDIAPYVEIVDAESVTSGGPAMSYFEVVTGIALALFAEAPVDVAIIEVGMGGGWDATNVVDAGVSVVTPIDLDHLDYLGPTVVDVAAEKSGIVKAGSIAVLAAQRPEVAPVLLARCELVGATALREGPDFGVASRELAVGGQLVTLQTGSPGGDSTVYPDILLPLHGTHQAHNAAVALATVEAFLSDGTRSLDLDLVREGFAAVSSPGRLEVLRRSPTVLVDAAHNPHGARALADAINDSFAFEHLVGVLAMLSDKDARAMVEALEPVLNEVVVTASRSPRALSAADLADIAREVFGDDRVRVAGTIAEALELAVESADAAALDGAGAGVLVTGSVVTAAEARALMGSK